MHRHAVEADLSFRPQVVEHAIGFRIGDQIERGVVELQQVDVVGAQAAQRLLDGEPDVRGREARVVRHRERGVGADLGERPAQRLREPGDEERVHVAVVEVASDLGRDDDVGPDTVERGAQHLLRMPVPVHVRRIEEGASQLVRPSHGAPRLGVVGGTVRIAEPISADGPGAEADRAHGQAGAAEHPPLHPSRSRSPSGVATGSEQVPLPRPEAPTPRSASRD